MDRWTAEKWARAEDGGIRALRGNRFGTDFTGMRIARFHV